MNEYTLVLVRHGQSEWNLKNMFTGLFDPELTDQGRKEAFLAGKKLKEKKIRFDFAFTSILKRSKNTCDLILSTMNQLSVVVSSDKSLNERDYGSLSGLNKDFIYEKWGKEKVNVWRRSYYIPPPDGESLRDTSARVWLYYISKIQPRILQKKTVLIVAHGNSLRSIVMIIEKLNEYEIEKYEVKTGIPIVYKLSSDLTVKKKETLDK